MPVTEEKVHKLLIVEDSDEYIDILIETLEDDYRLSVAKVGERAIELCDEHTDLVLLDVGLPDINGYEVCQKIRKKGLQVPVIFVTGSNKQEDIVKGKNAGGNDFIAKPYSLVELQEKILFNLN